MNDKRYTLILYVIVFVILGTIGIQVYWNYKNYLINKQQLINDVQVSMDNAVETYYANLAERNTVGFAFKGNSDNFFERNKALNGIIHRMDLANGEITNLDSLDIEVREGFSIYRGPRADSIFGIYQNDNNPIKRGHEKVITQYSLADNDSTITNNLKRLTSKVVISLTRDTLSLKAIDTLFVKELKRKNLNLNYGLSFGDSLTGLQYISKPLIETSGLRTLSKSPYLPNHSELIIYFSNETKIILKRILSGILLSTLLVLAVISCLFYLLKIIKRQKQLAEIKNDLISNITHEFKTPIATISVALESISNFDVINDKEKTKTYLDMSSDQLSKLNIMVEKLLETATLDSDNLDLKKEITNIDEYLENLVSKHQLQNNSKSIKYFSKTKNIMAKVDPFHFENAINNVLDNAIKYGGKNITVNLAQNSIAFTIIVSDDGNCLINANKDRIFEKFYRVPKGNTHNVKGFGIGLYYTKKIIEKHGGAIHLNLENKLTSFKMSFPNE